MKKLISIPLFLLLIAVQNGKAQLVCDAGNDTILCHFTTGTDTYQLGGQPTASGGSGNYTYKWSFNYHYVYQGDTLFSYDASDCLSDSLIANPILDTLVTDSMFFILTVTDDSGNTCKDSVLIRFSNIISDLSAYVYWFQPGDSLQICGGLSSNIAPVTPQWYPNEYITDTTAYCTYVYPEEDICYGFKITDGAGCEDYTNDRYCFIKGYFDIDEQGFSEIKIAPNPFENTFVVLLNSFLQKEKVTVNVYDVLGKAKNTEYSVLNDKIIIDGSQLQKGIYTLELILEKHRYINQVIKQ